MSLDVNTQVEGGCVGLQHERLWEDVEDRKRGRVRSCKPRTRVRIKHVTNTFAQVRPFSSA